jgi:hypothetical protein
MPDDKNRLDLNKDLGKLADDLLKDVQAATQEVRQRKASDAEKDRRNAARRKDRRLSAIIVIAAAVVLFVIAYFTVFARQSGEQVHLTLTQPQRQNTRIVQPNANRPAPRTPPRPASNPNPNQANPPNEYDQPGQ